MTSLLTYLSNYFTCKNTEKVNPFTTPIVKIDSNFESVPSQSPSQLQDQTQVPTRETYQEIQSTNTSTIITQYNGVKIPVMMTSSMDNNVNDNADNETTEYILTERMSRNDFTNNRIVNKVISVMNSNNYIEYIKIYAVELLDNMDDDFIGNISFHDAHSNYIPRLQYYRMYLQTDIDSVFDGTIKRLDDMILTIIEMY